MRKYLSRSIIILLLHISIIGANPEQPDNTSSSTAHKIIIGAVAAGSIMTAPFILPTTVVSAAISAAATVAASVTPAIVETAVTATIAVAKATATVVASQCAAIGASPAAAIISKVGLSLSAAKGGYWCAGKIQEEVFPNTQQKAERNLMELENKKALEKPFAQQLKERKEKRLYLISYHEYQACLLKNENNPASCPEQKKAFLDACEKYKE